MNQRVNLAHAPTPLEPMDRLAAAIDLRPGALWVKREDATGLGGGGNKVRKLEYLCAEAFAQGCDTLVTGGGPQSNHVRVTAAAAAKLGLACVAVLGGEPAGLPVGNLLLDHHFGAEVMWVGPLDFYDLERAISDEVVHQRQCGRRPYHIPLGGASETGTLGYVRVAKELLEQAPDVDLVVTADGTGGTHAGLAAGLGSLDRILGVDAGTRPDLDEWVPQAAAAAAKRSGMAIPGGTCNVDHRHIGAGYGAPTDDCRHALRLAARTEGLLLDPVYSGKALAGLIAAVGEGRIASGTKVVFLHTGGWPALFSEPYDRWLLESGQPHLPDHRHQA